MPPSNERRDMELAFWIVGIVGIVIALTSFIGADFLDVDIDVLPDGVVSTTSIAATLAGFGFGGVIASGLGVESDLAIFAIAVAAAAVGWVLAFVVYLFMKGQETDDNQSDINRLVGETAHVVFVPSSKNGWGELTTSFRGQRMNMNFRCDEKVAVGDIVTITTVISAQQALVSKGAAESNQQ